MSSEPPPQPVSDTFNYSQWNVDQNLTVASATMRFLSKVLNDTAAGVISFAQGLKSNLITVYTGTVLTIGESGKSILLYSPTSATTLSETSNNFNIPTTDWVNRWFNNYILVSTSNTWSLSQNFASGIYTATIAPYFSSILTLGSASSTQTNIWFPTLISTTPADTDNSTSIITSAWVNNFWTYVRTQAYSWTGNQTFTNGITTDGISSTSTSATVSIAGANTTGNIYIGNSITRTGSILIGAKAFFPASNTISVGSAGVAQTSLNGNIVNVGINTTNTTVNIGYTGTTTNIYSPVLASTIPSDTDNSTSIITSAWVNSWWTFTKTQSNVFSASQIFSALPYITASYASITGGDTTNIAITTSWLNNTWLVYLQTLANTWSAVQTFSALPLVSASYSGIAGSSTTNTIITANWINATWLPYLRGLANTWTLLQTFTAGISATLPIRVTYAPSSITVNTMIGYTYQASVTNITVTSTRRCQCVLNGTAGVGTVLPAGVYTVTYTAYLNTTTTGYLAGIVVRPTITNGTTSATGGVLNLYGGLQSRVQSTTAPFYISGSTTLILDGTDCVSVGIESTTTNTSNVDIYCQATRIA